MKRRFGAAAVLAATMALAACDPNLPAPQDVQKVITADQGWSKAERFEYYANPQGTVLLPAAWWFSLEEPASETLLSDKTLLSQFGFLVDDMKPVGKGTFTKDRLPVGLTLQTITDPSGRTQQLVGMGCAACHTGQINYKNTGIRIDGGQAMVNLPLLQSTIAQTILTTYLEPMKFKRFAQRVLAYSGELYTEENKQAVRTQLKVAYDEALAAITTQSGLYPVEEGFGRLDALQRIANTLLGDDLNQPSNYQKGTAPVSIPHVWDAPHFDWVQWNGSVRQAMIRNVGEALGVKSMTNFIAADGTPTGQPNRWWTSIPVHELHRTETLLRTLKAPKWNEEVLGKVDMTLAGKGRELFVENCASCHGVAKWKVRNWAGKHVDMIQTKTVGVEVMGTDPQLLDNFNTRTYDASKLAWYDGKQHQNPPMGFNGDNQIYLPTSKENPYGAGLRVNAGEGLFLVTQLVKNYQYNLGDRPVPAEQWSDYDGFGMPNEVRATCGYKARPLDGVWATAPFLHNGSVPTLYHLLSPQEERPTVFYVGNREFDPKLLGNVYSPFKNGTKFNTEIQGNRNTGHLFSSQPGAGVIGRHLKEDERYAILEFMKVMDRFPTVTRSADPYADKDYPCAKTLPSYSNRPKAS